MPAGAPHSLVYVYQSDGPVADHLSFYELMELFRLNPIVRYVTRRMHCARSTFSVTGPLMSYSQNFQIFRPLPLTTDQAIHREY